MSRSLILTVLVFISLGVPAQNLWIVSNQGGANADFTNVQAAINAASPGDKIYVEGSPTPYGVFNVNKKVHLIGAGFWKPQNNIPDPNVYSTRINSNNFDPAVIISADSAIVEGFDIVWLEISGDHVVFRYNRVCCKQGGTTNFGLTRLGGYPDGVFIYGNFLQTGLRLAGSNISVFNNIIQEGYVGGGGTDLWHQNGSCVNCVVQNNSLGYQGFTSGAMSNCTFRNNIVDFSDFSLTTVMFHNNIFEDDDVTVDGTPTDSLGNGNIDSVDINTIWDYGYASADGIFQLIGDSTTNVAFGAGINGEDCGAFGGNTPYILSGIVPRPIITQLLIPLAGDTTNVLNVTIKAKSND